VILERCRLHIVYSWLWGGCDPHRSASRARR
jgi:hypothetical protein